MSRGSATLALALAVLIGVLSGVLAFLRVGPLPLPTSPNPSVSSPATTPSGSLRPSPSPSASPSGSTPSPSVTPSGTPTPQPGPAFTERALLQPEEFLANDWGSATVTQSWTGLPPDQITSCSPITTEDGPPVAAYAATYRGLSTTAAEIAVRYYSDTAANVAMQRIIDRINTCADRAVGQPALTTARMDPPAPDGISELYLWDSTGSPKVEGVVALARAGDRIALLSLVSTTSDPAKTTKVGPLALQAGRRLI